MKLQDRIAIVTGGGQGIGREYVRGLSREGAKVVVAEIQEANGQKVAEEVNELGGDATFLHLDLAKEESCLDVAKKTIERYGGIDILVNNGAIYHSMRRETFTSVPLDYFNHFMSVNMTGQMLMTRAVVPAMRERGKGKVVFQSSGAAYIAGSSPYALSKVAVLGLTRGFAQELGKYNINVNCIAPGPIDTEATRVTTPKEIIDGIVKRSPLGRMGSPQDLIGALIYLVSDESDFMTGQTLLLDGGEGRRF